MVRTGVDLIEIERVAAAIDRFGPRFLERIFTPNRAYRLRQQGWTRWPYALPPRKRSPKL